MEEELIDKIVQEVVKQLSTEVYTDGMKPGVKEIGKALETVIGFGNTILTPIAILNDTAKFIRSKNLNKLNHKLKEIEESNLEAIDPMIGIPVLRRLEYTSEEELVELFLNLLKQSADKSKIHLAHPSFVNVIANLSPDEAKILKYIYTENIGICTVSIRVLMRDKTFSDHRVHTTMFDVTNMEINFKQNIRSYISNLKSLGLVDMFATALGEKQYKLIEEFLEPFRTSLNKEYPENHRVVFRRRHFGLTEKGKLFMACCLGNN